MKVGDKAVLSQSFLRKFPWWSAWYTRDGDKTVLTVLTNEENVRGEYIFSYIDEKHRYSKVNLSRTSFSILQEETMSIEDVI